MWYKVHGKIATLDDFRLQVVLVECVRDPVSFSFNESTVSIPLVTSPHVPFNVTVSHGSTENIR